MRRFDHDEQPRRPTSEDIASFTWKSAEGSSACLIWNSFLVLDLQIQTGAVTFAKYDLEELRHELRLEEQWALNPRPREGIVFFANCSKETLTDPLRPPGGAMGPYVLVGTHRLLLWIH